jgi:hypothetical protein
MNLQKTIEELEGKAAEYTEAANSLRTLLPYEHANGNSQTRASGQNGSVSSSKVKAKPGPKRQLSTQGAAQTSAKQTKGQKTTGKRSPVSPETRAKISAAIKARHQQKKAGNA